jgi:hypothetical protein
VLLLYGVVPADSVLPDGMGRVEGAQVAVAFRQVAEPPAGEQDEMVRYGESVAVLSMTGAVLPFRFGTVVGDRDALASLVEEREAEWLGRLGAVRDKVEMVVHAESPTSPAPTPPLSGRDYVMGRVARLREHDRLVADLTVAVGELASELRELRATDGLRLAVLVPKGRVADLCSALEQWQAGEPGRAASATGPWPPFSFTSSQEAAS